MGREGEREEKKWAQRKQRDHLCDPLAFRKKEDNTIKAIVCSIFPFSFYDNQQCMPLELK